MQLHNINAISPLTCNFTHSSPTNAVTTRMWHVPPREPHFIGRDQLLTEYVVQRSQVTQIVLHLTRSATPCDTMCVAPNRVHKPHDHHAIIYHYSIDHSLKQTGHVCVSGPPGKFNPFNHACRFYQHACRFCQPLLALNIKHLRFIFLRSSLQASASRWLPSSVNHYLPLPFADQTLTHSLSLPSFLPSFLRSFLRSVLPAFLPSFLPTFLLYQ
jgi:hypothetical protein